MSNSSGAVPDLATRWSARWNQAREWMGLGMVFVPIGERLLERHCEPGRHYHDARHILSCLQTLDNYPGSVGDSDAVELALWLVRVASRFLTVRSSLWDRVLIRVTAQRFAAAEQLIRAPERVAACLPARAARAVIPWVETPTQVSTAVAATGDCRHVANSMKKEGLA